MGGVFRTVGKDGKVTYGDAAVPGSQAKTFRPDGSLQSPSAADKQEQQQKKDYDEAKSDIKNVRKYGLKVNDYLEKLDYLRHNNPVAMDRMLADLKKTDPKTWLLLQKSPMFQPLRRTIGVAGGGSNMLGAVVGAPSGDIPGSVQKWADGSLKDVMKRDGYYSDVLGAKSMPLTTPKRTYAASNFGRWLAEQEAKLASALKGSTKSLEAAAESLRSAKATAVVRPGGTVLDIEIALLDPAYAHAGGVIELRKRLDRYAETGVVTEMDFPDYLALLNQGKYVELRDKLDQAFANFKKAPR